VKPIEYKLQYDSRGGLSHLELWQNGQHIKLSLALKSPTPVGYKWDEVKYIIDQIAAKVQKESLESGPIYE
jgi:hypothetical protein